MNNRLVMGLVGVTLVTIPPSFPTDASVPGSATSSAMSVPSLSFGTEEIDTVTMRSGTQDRRSVAITVYNQNFGLVREVRRLNLPGDRVELEYQDVASSIQPETVHIRRLDSGDLTVLEQNYRYDLLTPRKLLEKHVGQTVTLYRREANGSEEAVQAEILSVAEGVVLRIDGEITYDVPGRFAFPRVPENLIPEPTLVWLIDAERGQQDVEVSYLAGEMGWKADYVVVLEDDERHGDMTGWVTLTNRSGTGYENAQLKLVAGDVQRVMDVLPRMRVEAMMAMEERSSAGFAEESFFEYHLYTLDRPTSVLNNEQKQVTLLEAADFGTTKRLVFEGASYYFRGQYGEITRDQKIATYLEWKNSESEGLGMPLPAGIVRVYKRDSSGAQQFIGEDRIDHTPRDETVRIKLGEAFDVVGDRRQMTYSVLGSCSSESTWEVELRNHKDEAVKVDVIEHANADWEIVDANAEWARLDSQSFRFQVDVPARDAKTVKYRIRVRWC